MIWGIIATGSRRDFLGFQVGFVQRNTIAGDVESLEHVRAFENRPVGIELHFAFRRHPSSSSVNSARRRSMAFKRVLSFP